MKKPEVREEGRAWRALGRKGVAIPVSQEADVKPKEDGREFIGGKKCSQRKEQEEESQTFRSKCVPDARERREEESVAEFSEEPS